MIFQPADSVDRVTLPDPTIEQGIPFHPNGFS
jgi:hypothetical protein